MSLAVIYLCLILDKIEWNAKLNLYATYIYLGIAPL